MTTSMSDEAPPVIRRGNVLYLTGTEVPLSAIMALWFHYQRGSRAERLGAIVSIRTLYYPGLTYEQIRRAIEWDEARRREAERARSTQE